MFRKISSVVIICLLFSAAAFGAESDKSDTYGKNFSADPESVNLMLSTITYTQSEQDKRFIANMKFFISNNFLLNLDLESSGISENEGPLAFLGPLKGDETQLSSGAKVKVGVTWSDYYSKRIKHFNVYNAMDIYKSVLKENKFHTFKTKGDLKYIPYAIDTYEEKVKDYKERLLTEIKQRIEKWKVPPVKNELFNFANQLNQNSDVDQIAKTLGEGPGECDKCKELLDYIKIQLAKANRVAIDEAVEKHDLYKFVSPKDIPLKLKRQVEHIFDEEIKNVSTIAINYGRNYTAINYYDPAEKFEKKGDSYGGYDIEVKFGHFFNPNEMIGASYTYSEFGKTPDKQTIIQEFTIDDNPVVPETLVSKQVLLEPLSRQWEKRFRVEYRKYFYSFFAVNPFLRYIEAKDKSLDRITFAIDGIFSFDKDRNWILGVRPMIEWSRNDNEKWEFRKHNLGVAIFLSKTFRLNPAPWERKKMKK